MPAAPSDAKYIVQELHAGLDAEQSLGDLTTGLLKNTVTAGVGVLSTATEGTDYYKPGGTDVAVADGGTGSSTASGARSNLGAAASGANADITSMTGLTGAIKAPTQIEDSSGNEVLKFSSAVSAVNELTVKNAATGSAPELQATGGDANIDVNVVPKGTGKLTMNGNEVYRAGGTDVPVADGGTGSSTASGARSNLGAATSGANGDITSMTGLTGAIKAPTQIEDSNSNELLKFSSTASAVNEITIKNNSTGNAPEIQATGGDTNIDVKIVPKGTGLLKANALTLSDQPSCFVYRTSNFTFTVSGTWYTIDFDTDAPTTNAAEEFDIGGMHDGTTNNSRLTVPSGQGGIYLVGGSMSFAGNSTGMRGIGIIKNNTTYFSQVEFPAGSTGMTFTTSVILNLAAGDWVTLAGMQSSTASLDSASGRTGPALWAVKLF